MKIGIYGGTFNPPHLGHLTSARFAMEALGLDKLLFMPAGTPPHKVLPEGSPTPEQRLRMMELAADSMLLPDRVEISDLELQREGKSFTSDTLRQLHEVFPDDEQWFLMGRNMILTHHKWHEPEVICSLAHLAAFV